MSGWVLLLVVCFGLIAAVAYQALTHQPVDDTLGKLAGVAAGFLFGTIPTFLKDLLTSEQGKT
jgi:xanthine/uracil permease